MRLSMTYKTWQHGSNRTSSVLLWPYFTFHLNFYSLHKSLFSYRTAYCDFYILIRYVCEKILHIRFIVVKTGLFVKSLEIKLYSFLGAERIQTMAVVIIAIVMTTPTTTGPTNTKQKQNLTAAK